MMKNILYLGLIGTVLINDIVARSTSESPIISYDESVESTEQDVNENLEDLGSRSVRSEKIVEQLDPPASTLEPVSEIEPTKNEDVPDNVESGVITEESVNDDNAVNTEEEEPCKFSWCKNVEEALDDGRKKLLAGLRNVFETKRKIIGTAPQAFINLLTAPLNSDKDVEKVLESDRKYFNGLVKQLLVEKFDILRNIPRTFLNVIAAPLNLRTRDT